MAVELAVQVGNVTQIEADALLLKYARAFHGADAEVAAMLTDPGVCTDEELRPGLWDAVDVETHAAIKPKRLILIGTPDLRDFRYAQMERFAQRAIEVLRRGSLVRTLATTIHGAGYGLDPEESLQAMVRGFQRALAQQPVPGLTRIVFVEWNRRRADALSRTLDELPSRLLANPELSRPQPVSAPAAPPDKKRVFVAMAFGEEFADTYQFGIYDVVRKCGFVCERVDESTLVGSIVDQIQEGIRNAEFIIADLTAERPNVYLEVGFAWGLQRKVLLLARDGTKLHFDLSHHKCIFYKTIGKLAEELEKTIRKLSPFTL